MPRERAGFPAELSINRSRRIALQDYLTRAFSSAASRIAKGDRGSGASGLIQIDRCGQEILERSSCRVREEDIEVRFVMGLPAAGRTILGREAEEMFFGELLQIMESSLFYNRLNADRLARHVKTAEDQDRIRDGLRREKMVAFIAEGSLLPRRSGVDERPLTPFEGFEGEDGLRPAGELPADVVPFQTPESLRIGFTAPNGGPVTGMGIPEGITLIVGGGFHGKSTLLRAIDRGVYNHIPGDGREYVVTREDAVKIRAEDGRSISGVDISPFINNLPLGRDTGSFSTQNASGSTSQAANIMEALEMGCRLLLIDEDTSATNFMIRDQRMQALVPKKREPITSFIDKVRQLYVEYGVSTILVMGGSGDYFEVADTVLQMDNYRPVDVTVKAREVAGEFRERRAGEGGESFGRITSRIPLPGSFDPVRRPARDGSGEGRGPGTGRAREKVSAKTAHNILYGRTDIDLSCLEQLVDISQTRAIGEAIRYASAELMDGRATLKEVVDSLTKEMDERGLEVLFPPEVGNLARPRPFEIAAAINRMRTLKTKQQSA
jgi:predicted ABC-class ATPase